MKYVIIGAGSRGMIYGTLAKARGVEIAAIAEKRPDRNGQSCLARQAY